MTFTSTSSISMRCRNAVLAVSLSLFVACPALAATELATSKSAAVKQEAKNNAPVKPHVGIAAQVGDEAISSVDLENRIKFIIVTAHLSSEPDVVQKIRPQVIRSLVDEKLELQEAAKNDITITDKDVSDAIEAIEQQRGMPAGAIAGILESNHVPKDTFTQQIRAQLSWNHLLMKKIRPQIRVSETEVTMASNHMVAEPAPREPEKIVPKEYKIGAVTLPVDKPAREKEIKGLGDKLVNEVRSGANFEEVSRHFSSDTASAGGKVDIFWVKLEQVDPHVAQALQGAKAGTITEPIRTSAGFTIIKIYETRDIAVKKPAKSVKTPKAASDAPSSHDQVYGMLIQQKMGLEAQKYLRNLRRETFIDIR